MPLTICHLCDKSFTTPSNLKRHYKNVHFGQTSPATSARSSPSLKCGICGSTSSSVHELNIHLSSHDIKLDNEDFEFNNLSEFETWKLSIEKNQNSFFVKHRGNKKSISNGSSIETAYYQCNRSGSFRGKSLSPSKRKRHIKIQGSAKIDAYCPAHIKVVFHTEGKITVSFCKTHVGHEAELVHIPLPNDEKKHIAAQISQHIPFDSILESVQESVQGEVKRKHILTKQDLRNIVTEYSLDSECIRNTDDALSIEAWVDEVRASDDDCILLYKPNGTESSSYPQLKSDDFMLGIMTDAQAEMFKKYGQDCICIDSTHGTNAYNIEMTTILVLDDMRQGFPCAFLFSNRNDHVALEIFLESIKKRTGIINAKVLMTDMAGVFYNSWKAEMGDVQHRLFCTWHVQRAWQKRINLIKNESKRTDTAKKMFTLHYEVDENTFEQILPVIINGLCADTDTEDFGKYLKENYVANRKSWAYCFRKNAGVNTNMHLERLHGIFKHFYLKGKLTKRLDITVHAVMKFISRKLFDRIIILQKGKLTSKLRNIRDRHKKSLGLSVANVLQTSNNTWSVFSSSTVLNVYSVTRNEITCKCSLLCSYCKTCIHQFNCTCTDAAIQWNMCKHIHLVCKAQKRSEMEATPQVALTGQVENNTSQLSEKDETLEQDEKSHEMNVIMSAVSKQGKMSHESDLASLKQRNMDAFLKMTNQTHSVKQARIMEKALRYVESQMKAIYNEELVLKTFNKSQKINVRKNIDPQRKFKVKKNKVTKKRAVKPEATEANKIAITALMNFQPSTSSTREVNE